MAKDISSIPTEELEKDLFGAEEDIQVCLTAMSMGVNSYGDGLIVTDRYEDSRLIRARILMELKHRGHAKEEKCHTSQ